MSSKKALEAALDAAREQVRKAKGKADVPTPEFQDASDVVLADFRTFADALAKLAADNPEVVPEDLAQAAIIAMIRTSPDCHTTYVDDRVYESRPVQATGDASPALPQGLVIAQPDEAGLQARMLAGGIAYVRWTEFRLDGTYDIRAKVKAVLEKAVAAGAKAWLFDLRGNVGGNGPEIIASYFLNGEPGVEVILRNGKAGVRGAIPAFRLPAEYQLPIVIVQNDRGGSGPELFTVFLKENRRATVVGKKTVGCLGATSITQLPDGSRIGVVVEEYVGAVTGSRYNNVGIPPDVEAGDAAAVDIAVKILKEQIAKGSSG